MDNVDKLMDFLPEEITRSLSEMSKTSDPEKKRIYSEIVLNLSESMGVFIDALSLVPPDPLFDDGPDDEFREPVLEMHKPKKRNKKKKGTRGKDTDLPF
ncbi:MAG: hypothetical protein GF350_13050 [Chitinivibrionales bacterium]|nr:hypothetical protein [Chitinivibrionales bacterium]